MSRGLREKVDVEELFASRARVRILRIILKEGQATITRLAREAGLNNRRVAEHMRALSRLGIVEERKYGRLRLYELRHKDPRVGALREIMEALERL